MKKYKVLLLILVFSASPCFAYIDPGMGGFIWQSVIAISAGALFHLAQFLKSFKKKKLEAATKAAPITTEVKDSHGSDNEEVRTAA